MKYLSDNGLKTWVSIEPYPTPSLVEQDLLEILQAVSFTDKIIFGKVNYNVKTSFKDNEEFYEDCAEMVKNFCTANDIQYHIKRGTQKEDNKEKLMIKRPEKFGGNLEFGSYEALEKVFVEKKLHPMDLKSALVEELDKLVEPVRKELKAKERLIGEAYPDNN